jgi:hypothetical protein
MTENDHIRRQLARAVALPDSTRTAPPRGSELRDRARRRRAVRQSSVLVTILIVALVVTAAWLWF